MKRRSNFIPSDRTVVVLTSYILIAIGGVGLLACAAVYAALANG